MESISKINNSIYHSYGDKWYDAYDDPIALLRAENEVKLPWIFNRINQQFPDGCDVLDVGCGAGFLCNELAMRGLNVSGIDIAEDSLEVARNHDSTGSVKYFEGDAYSLPFHDESFDVVTNLDFLEHVDHPDEVIQECARVLKPGGLFFFHTFNRNLISHLLVIKAVEFFVKNTPKDMHVIELFITPKELKDYCSEAGIEVSEMTGIRPKFSSIPFKNLFTGIVPHSMEFTLTKSLKLSYMGVGRKL